MKIIMYENDKGGLHTYSKYLVEALKKKGVEIIITNKILREDYEIIHFQFENSLFHPFGLGVIKKMFFPRLRGKKIVLTMHTVLKKDQIYARNFLFKSIKKIILPLTNKLIGIFSDKIIVHSDYLKKILINEYSISKKKVEVIPHGTY